MKRVLIKLLTISLLIVVPLMSYSQDSYDYKWHDTTDTIIVDVIVADSTGLLWLKESEVVIHTYKENKYNTKDHKYFNLNWNKLNVVMFRNTRNYKINK